MVLALGTDIARILDMQIDGVRVLSVNRHGNKLRTGHLQGNRFVITLRDVALENMSSIISSLEEAGRVGVPNAYGKQRFGRDDDNDQRALAWLRGDEQGPRDPKKRRFLFSALQSRAFNLVLAERVKDGTFATPIEGDLLCVHRSGGIFTSENLDDERARAAALEICPTGPMPGAKMKLPTGAALALEQAITAKVFGTDFDFARTSSLGEGTRRPLRMLVSEMKVEKIDRAEDQGVGALRVYFVLPKGAYATTVLASCMDTVEPYQNEIKDESAAEAEAPRTDDGNT